MAGVLIDSVNPCANPVLLQACSRVFATVKRFFGAHLLHVDAMVKGSLRRFFPLIDKRLDIDL